MALGLRDFRATLGFVRMTRLGHGLRRAVLFITSRVKIVPRAITQMESVLKAVANRRRLRMLRVLKKRRELHVGALADEVEIPLKTVSRNLRLMERTGLLVSETRAGRVFYRVGSELSPFAGKLVGAISAEED
jgi:DNA-binding transcriptional ArsR family regulator